MRAALEGDEVDGEEHGGDEDAVDDSGFGQAFDALHLPLPVVPDVAAPRVFAPHGYVLGKRRWKCVLFGGKLD